VIILASLLASFSLYCILAILYPKLSYYSGPILFPLSIGHFAWFITGTIHTYLADSFIMIFFTSLVALKLCD